MTASIRSIVHVYIPDLPKILHAVDVVIQQIRLADAQPFKVSEFGHARPLVVGDAVAVVRKVEAVCVLALYERKSVVEVKHSLNKR